MEQKSNTLLHCMAHSLVPEVIPFHAWLQDGISMNKSKCLKRLLPNQTDLQKVYAKYGAFSSGLDYFNQPHWANHGASTPLIQALAFKLLVQPASSSCCERNWSTYSLVQSVTRNRLATSRAEDLVFVHCNLCLLSRQSLPIFKDQRGGGDLFDIKGCEMMELAQLSLDDPCKQ
ncbi:hypothetical protein ACSBR2_033875 [Camellia fascicularis]